jgi:DNA-binding transcriptional ArsR family regulator
MHERMAHDGLDMVVYNDNPPVHLFGDSEAAIERMRLTAEQARCRVLSETVLPADPAMLGECAIGAAALIELDGGAEHPQLIALLDWAQGEAEAGSRRSVVCAPAALTDLIAACAPHDDVIHLCAASAAERTEAAARASRRRPWRLNDVGRDEGSLILQQLSEDVGRIAAILASLSEEDAAPGAAVRPGPRKPDEPGIDAAFIRSIIRARRLRDQFFRGELFADPAWDMLLDLMAARLEKNRVAVSSLCIAAAVPATTALRWIKALTDRGIFVRQADPEDGRRVYIELSDEAARALAAYLRAVQRVSTTGI